MLFEAVSRLQPTMIKEGQFQKALKRAEAKIIVFNPSTRKIVLWIR